MLCCYAICGTDIDYAATRRNLNEAGGGGEYESDMGYAMPYALSGTDVGYHPMVCAVLSYGMCGTELGYGAIQCAYTPWRGITLPYIPTHSPVLTFRMLLCAGWYALPYAWYWASVWCYAMCGTELAYGATPYDYWAWVWCVQRYWDSGTRESVRCYATYGTELANSTTRCVVLAAGAADRAHIPNLRTAMEELNAGIP
eukprot:1607162-Rhodomonas_salina.1